MPDAYARGMKFFLGTALVTAVPDQNCCQLCFACLRLSMDAPLRSASAIDCPKQAGAVGKIVIAASPRLKQDRAILGVKSTALATIAHTKSSKASRQAKRRIEAVQSFLAMVEVGLPLKNKNLICFNSKF